MFRARVRGPTQKEDRGRRKGRWAKTSLGYAQVEQGISNTG